MRQKPGLDAIETAITELAVGEALVSFRMPGPPSVTERVYVLLPGSQLGPSRRSSARA